MNEYLLSLRFGEHDLELIMLNELPEKRAIKGIRLFFNSRFPGVEILSIKKNFFRKRGIKRVKKKGM